MNVEIRREVVASGTNLEELKQTLKDKATALGMGETRSSNDHGPVFTTLQYDLRIERDPGEMDAFRVMLIDKQPRPTGLRERFKRRKS